LRYDDERDSHPTSMALKDRGVSPMGTRSPHS
jgi:hypothetical protein